MKMRTYWRTGAVTVTGHTEHRAPLAAVGVGCTAVAVRILLTLLSICIWKAHTLQLLYNNACGEVNVHLVTRLVESVVINCI